MFGTTEKITTVSRKEILREQVFECLFHTNIESAKKLHWCDELNALFAGELKVNVRKNIAFIDFENVSSSIENYKGGEGYEEKQYYLTTVGSNEIQSILANTDLITMNKNILSSILGSEIKECETMLSNPSSLIFRIASITLLIPVF